MQMKFEFGLLQGRAKCIDQLGSRALKFRIDRGSIEIVSKV